MTQFQQKYLQIFLHMKQKVTFTTKSITFREALWVSLIRPNSESYEGGSAGESRGNILFFVITYHLGQQPLHKMVEDLLRLPGALIYKYKYAPTFPCNPTPILLPPLHLSLRIVFLGTWWAGTVPGMSW